jgi:MFS family permease
MRSLSFAILLLSVALLCLGHGLQGSLIAISANKAEFRTDVTGLIMSGYSGGMLLSALLTPRLIRNVGHVRAFAGLASIVSTVILLIPLWVNPYFWFSMRLISGLCTSGLFIVCESWLNAFASNKTRGRLLSIYMIVTYGSLGCGQLLLNVQDDSGFARFIIVSALLSLSLVPLILLPTEAPEIRDAANVSIIDIWRVSPLAVVGSIANGLGQSAFFAMGSLFGLGKGLSVTAVSLMLALPSIGVIFSQFPIGWASDKLDRRSIILALSTIGGLIPVILLFSGILPSRVLIGLITLFGTLILPVYSLVVAHANDHMTKDQVLGASGKLVLLYGVGSAIGPILAGRVMYSVGPNGFLYYHAAVFLTLAGFAAWRVFMRPERMTARPGDTLQVGPTTTPAAAGILSDSK